MKRFGSDPPSVSHLDRIQPPTPTPSLKQLFEKGDVSLAKVLPYFLRSIKHLSSPDFLYVAVNCVVPNLDFGPAGSAAVVK